MPSAVDQELAVIFREMRRASHLDRNQLSDQLRTPVAVIEALETGAISSLPSWPETIRVVNSYTRMLGLDPRPILRRIRSQMDVTQASPQPKEVPSAKAFAPAAPGPARQPAVPAAARPPAPPMPPGADAERPVMSKAPRTAPPAAPNAAAAAPARPEAQEADDPPAGPVADTPDAELDFGELAGEGLPASSEEPGRPRGLIPRLLKWIFILALCGGLGYAISQVVRNPDGIVDAVSGLPEPIPSAARLVRDLITTAPGGKAPDPGAEAPRKEKSDRLPQDQAPAVR